MIFLGGTRDGFAQAGGNAELRAGSHGLLHVVGRQQSAGADDGVRQALPNARNGFGRASGAEGDFDAV